jgi:hypothetical protein
MAPMQIKSEVAVIVGTLIISLLFTGVLGADEYAAWIASYYYYVTKFNKTHIWPLLSRFGQVKLVACKPKSHGAYARL